MIGVLRHFLKKKVYNGVSWVSYQYYWSFYPDTSQSVVMLTPQIWAPRIAAITSIFKRSDDNGYSNPAGYCLLALSEIQISCSSRLLKYEQQKETLPVCVHERIVYWKTREQFQLLRVLLLTRLENIMAKGDICHYEKCLRLTQYFKMSSAVRSIRKQLYVGKG